MGAGLSGIGAAVHLQRECPEKSYAILESRDAIGGTWDLFRYPGIRSDSDMFTLGYSFKPWMSSKAIADGPDILSYVNETATENGINQNIRYRHRATSAEWSSENARWTISIERTDTGEMTEMTCDFLFTCTGYYRYDEGYTPEFEGREDFRGQVIHPQHWPEDLDYAGKQVVVIGSGATAVTLVPAMAESASHVTMLQRSPTYIASLPAKDPIANFARRLLPTKLGYAFSRWKNVLMTMAVFNLSRSRPRLVKGFLLKAATRQLPPGYDVAKHFKPSYNPWDQRMCLVPDGDLFKAIREERASVVTDHIDRFTEGGIRLKSGEELEADIIVSATGLNLVPVGGMSFTVDGREISLPDTMGYKGMMIGGIPNFAFAIGYTNASWTLKCDLTCEYVCRLLNHMDERGFTTATPVNNDPSVTPVPFIDFNSGYILRAIDSFPKQGSKTPWRLHQNYAKDRVAVRRGSVEESMEFSSAARAPEPEPAAA